MVVQHMGSKGVCVFLFVFRSGFVTYFSILFQAYSLFFFALFSSAVSSLHRWHHERHESTLGVSVVSILFFLFSFFFFAFSFDFAV